MPVDYQKAKIYRIVNDTIPDMVYYGSTCQTLSMRMVGHRTASKKNIYGTSKQLFETGKAVIVLVENFPCNSKEELYKRERWFIENNSCVNKNIPGRNMVEYRQDNIERDREYSNEYRKKNKEEIKKYQKEYMKGYREENKEKITCECGSTFSKINITRHNKSARHQEFNLI